jgi:hypothetical protein
MGNSDAKSDSIKTVDLQLLIEKRQSSEKGSQQNVQIYESKALNTKENNQMSALDWLKSEQINQNHENNSSGEKDIQIFNINVQKYEITPHMKVVVDPSARPEEE